MTAVRVIELHKSVIAALSIYLSLLAIQYLIGCRRCVRSNSLRPVEKVCILAIDVLGICSSLCRVLRFRDMMTT